MTYRQALPAVMMIAAGLPASAAPEQAGDCREHEQTIARLEQELGALRGRLEAIAAELSDLRSPRQPAGGPPPRTADAGSTSARPQLPDARLTTPAPQVSGAGPALTARRAGEPGAGGAGEAAAPRTAAVSIEAPTAGDATAPMESASPRATSAPRAAEVPSEPPRRAALAPASFAGGGSLSRLNPEISATGDLFYRGGSDVREEFSTGEWEVDLRSALDPFSRMHLTLALPDGESPEIEEGFIEWNGLLGGLGVAVGRRRADFGTLNRWHGHALDQIDYPWVITEAFGEEGLKGTGLFVSWLPASGWTSANEVSIALFNADNEVAFGGEAWDSPALLARVKNFWDVGSSGYFEANLTGLRGEWDPAAGLGQGYVAADLAFNWAPAGSTRARELMMRGMILRSSRERPGAGSARTTGGFLYGQYRFSQRWIAGLRFDATEEALAPGVRAWGLSPYLTFWESEFVRLRAQASYRDHDLDGIDRRFWLQITLAAGPHKHESY